jgi:hypothetical protein
MVIFLTEIRMSIRKTFLSGLLFFSLVFAASGEMVDYSKHIPPEVFIFPTPRQAEYGKLDIDLTGAAIVIPEKASVRVRTAAEDLNANLVRQIPKTKPLLILEKIPSGNSTVILLGTAGKHEGLDRMLAEEKMTVNPNAPGPQGYCLAVRQEGERKFVLLAGSDDQGAYWAMTSFIQLLRAGKDGKVLAYSATVRDWPAFNVRMTGIQTETGGHPVEVQLQRLGMAIRMKTNVSCYSGFDQKVNDFCRARGFKPGANYWIFQGIGKKAQDLGVSPASWSNPGVLQAWADQYKAAVASRPGIAIQHDCTDAGWWNRYLNDFWNKRDAADKKAYPEANPGRADANRVNVIYRAVKSVSPETDVYITVPCYYDSPQNAQLPNVKLFREYLKTLGSGTPEDIYWILEDRSPDDCSAYAKYMGRHVVNYKYPTASGQAVLWTTTFAEAGRFARRPNVDWFYCVGHPYHDLLLAGAAEYMWNPDLPVDYQYLVENFIPRACKFLFGNAWRQMADFFINYNIPLDALAEGKSIGLLRTAREKVAMSVGLLKTARDKCDPGLPAGRSCIDQIFGMYEPTSNWLGFRILISEAFVRCQKAEMLVSFEQFDQAAALLREADEYLKKAQPSELSKYDWLKKEHQSTRELLEKLQKSIGPGRKPVGDLSVLKLDGQWQLKIDPENKGVVQQWYSEKADRTGWSSITVPGPWEKSGLPGMESYDGYGWYARTFRIPPAWKGKAVILHLDAVDDEAWVYVNGKLAGSHLLKDIPQQVCWEQPFEFDITEFIRPAVDNTVVVRVNDTKLDGGIWKSVWLRADKPGRPKEGPGLVEVKAVEKKKSP